MNKIFIIGFNKTGTRTLHHFFAKNKISALHWDNNNLIRTMNRNMALKRPLLHNGISCVGVKYDDITVFSDMTDDICCKDAKDYYQLLDEQYPESKFILNIRDTQSWIQSRHNHHAVTKRHMSFYGLTGDGDIKKLEKIWADMHKKHHESVIEYFSGRPKDLLVYDLIKDNPNKIVSFLKDYIELDVKHWKWQGKTT